ncbi:RNA polymerase sigma-70 factor [Tamlana fucoidanivorans]|uniref:RNA polymerase sigma-70 factor n=1 Tax=Allotamlana fucoidanivorans TaxID=2583814 RepID=A0A5C4SR97_9FLAO|nr:RNA polymerase sigma-70 factor [Tamlana fucoidanivorans]TNJ46956.1 RNA polymerase sigma-70 factor [Tamlana fucoidanivorans]
MELNKEIIKNIEQRLKEGDKDAFKEFYDLFYDKLFNYINSYTHDHDTTLDILQDSFIKLWDGRKSLKAGKSVIGLLYKISYNAFVDIHRKSKTEFKMLDTLAYKKSLELSTDNEDVKEARIEQMMLAIESLPPRCKEIFKMSKMEGIKYVDIAETLSISVKTVEVQMGKAFSIIREKVKNSNVFLMLINLIPKAKNLIFKSAKLNKSTY